AVVGLRRRRPRGVGHLGWIAAGVLLFAGGDLLHAAIVTLSEHPPEHTAAEVPWALATAAIGAGMLRLLLSARRTTRFDVDAAVDTAAAAILVVLLAWPVALHPVLTDATVSPGARANVAIFFCLDAVLLAALIRALMSRR